MKEIEHIGLAVSNLSHSQKIFSKLLNRKPFKKEKVESEGVTTLFYQLGNSKIELLESSNRNSVIQRFIEKRGEGIHHLAIAVENIEQEMTRLRKEGFLLLSEKPIRGADNKLICFLHPKSTGGILVELCQEITNKKKVLRKKEK